MRRLPMSAEICRKSAFGVTFGNARVGKLSANLSDGGSACDNTAVYASADITVAVVAACNAAHMYAAAGSDVSAVCACGNLSAVVCADNAADKII